MQEWRNQATLATTQTVTGAARDRRVARLDASPVECRRRYTDAFISRSRFPGLRFPAERRREAGPEEPFASLWTSRCCRSSCSTTARAPFRCNLVPEMAKLGLFGANLKGYGCAEMSNVEYGLVTQELERGDSGLRSFASVQSALVMYPNSCVWVGRAEGQVAAAAATGKSHRLLRADRTAVRLESGRDADARGEKWR